MIRSIRMALAAMLLVPLAACVTAVPASPGVVADATKLDEQAALIANLSYTAAAKGAALAIRTGIVKDPATIRRIGELDKRAYAAVVAVNTAYRTGNAASYSAALANARAAVAAFTDAF